MIKIGELSKISGASIQTIRFYEEKGLLCPVEVDRWTNYRYYDESSIQRLSEISHLKDLGFSLKEIKGFNEKSVDDKILETERNIEKLKQNIQKLSSIRSENGGIIMKNFVNDEEVVGKWKKLAVVKNKEDFASNNYEMENIFPFDELYFLPKGEEYWVFGWTKGTLFLKERRLPYEIIDGKLFVGVVDYKTGNVDNFAVYEKVDGKHYSRNEIAIKDNTDIPFITDGEVIGFWNVVDFVDEASQFNPYKPYWQEDMFLKKYTFEPDGTLLASYYTFDSINRLNWSKGVVIDKNISTVSEYSIKEIDGDKYMFVEWKSGDYTFGGRIGGYYVLKKVN